MSKFYGLKPEPETIKAIERFENEVMIRYNNQPLVGSVYIDVQDSSWAVAFAYNLSRHPGLYGHENPLEVRYSCPSFSGSPVRMFRSDLPDEILLQTERFSAPESIIRFILNHERKILNRPV